MAGNPCKNAAVRISRSPQIGKGGFRRKRRRPHESATSGKHSFSRAVARAKGPRRLCRFRVGQSQGPFETPET